MNGGNGIIILTDMLGGTPSNLTLSFLQEGKVEVITGVNLPMLMKLAQLRDQQDPRDAALALKQSGQKGIAWPARFSIRNEPGLLIRRAGLADVRPSGPLKRFPFPPGAAGPFWGN